MYPVSDPTARLKDGKFTAGDPVTNEPPSRVTASWMNLITESLIKVVEAGGETPADDDNELLLKAIEQLINDKASTFNYEETDNPTVNVAGAKIGYSWLNKTTGELFFCTDATAEANRWIGTAGTVVEVSAAWNPNTDPALALHYTFENIIGDSVADETGNNHATMHNSPVSVPTEHGQGLDFTGSNKYVDTNYKTNGGDYLISFWLLPSDTAKGAIYSEADQSLNSVGSDIRLIGDQVVFGHYTGVANDTDTCQAPVSEDQAVHIMCERENGVTNRIYKDGDLIGSSPCDSVGASTFTGKIGYQPNYTGSSNRNLSAVIDNVRIFSRILTDEERLILSETDGVQA